MDRCLDRFTEHATTDQVVGTIIHQAWADLRPAEDSKLVFRDPIDLPKLDEIRCEVSVDEIESPNPETRYNGKCRVAMAVLTSIFHGSDWYRVHSANSVTRAIVLEAWKEAKLCFGLRT